MGRSHLEALLVAFALLRPDRAEEFASRVEAGRLSSACRGLLTQLVNPYADETVHYTAGQQAIATRVEQLTIAQLLPYAPDCDDLIDALNQLPLPAKRPAAWERDLAIGLESVA